MDPRYIPPQHSFNNGQYDPFAQPPPPNAYQYGQPQPQPQFPGMQMHMQQLQMQQQMHQGFPPVQSSPIQHQGMIHHHQQPPQYAPMQQQMWPQQPQMHHQQQILPQIQQQLPLQAQPRPHLQQQQQRTQPQVMFAQMAPNSGMPVHMQMGQPQTGQPHMRNMQAPAQRPNMGGMSSIDGSHDQYQAQMTPMSKPTTSPYQENAQRPHTIPTTPVQNQNQSRAPLQPHATPRQRQQPPPPQRSTPQQRPYPHPQSLPLPPQQPHSQQQSPPQPRFQQQQVQSQVKPQTPAQVRPQATAHAQPQTPSQAPPQTPAHTQPQTPSQAPPHTPAHTQPQTPSQALPLTPAHIQLQTPSQVKPQATVHTQPQTPLQVNAQIPQVKPHTPQVKPQTPSQVRPQTPQVNPQPQSHVESHAPFQVQQQVQQQTQQQVQQLTQPRAQQQTQQQVQAQSQSHLQPQTKLQPQSRSPLQPQLQTPSTQHKTSSVQQTPSQSRTHSKVVVQRTPSHQLTTPTKQPYASPKALPVDLYVMLLSSADEYVAAARSMGPSIVKYGRDADLQQYYKLIATAMGCMHAVLKKFNILPRDEAKLRLRYAALLVEETDNTAEIDEVLSKGISLCGRCRLQDLKYSMLHLQARYQFKTNHRAALKALDKPINESETFQHIAWIYAFRFLKVSLTLQIPGRIESVPALQQLHAIQAHSERQGDRAVYVACSALEAMVHLRSGQPDRIEQAQRAIAAARSLQLQESARQLGSFGSLIDVIDLACSIQQGDPNNQKSTALIESMVDESNNNPTSESGVYGVLLERSSAGNMTFDTGGIFRKSSDGRDELVFAWLPREDLKTLCFHLCALDQNVHEKGLRYIKEAHHRHKGSLARQPSQGVPISTAFAQSNWGRVVDWNTIFTLGLIASYQEDGTTARNALSILKKRAARPPFKNQDIYTRALAYLTAILDQIGGHLDPALAAYSSDMFALPEKNTSASAKIDIAILAAVNRVLIVRDPLHPEHHTTGALLTELQTFCECHPNAYIKMAFRVVHAMSSPGSSINRQKTLTNNATSKSHELFKRTQNREFVIMSLCYFTWRFFVEQVTDKSMPAVQAVRQHAKSSNKPLWLAVACGLVITVFRHNNMVAEVERYQEVYDRVRPRLPPILRGDEDVDAEGEEDEEL